ncbi:hypothetical protein GmHk_U059438 [Glycine max]|nr:hypothetical protein GmHk_U059438 [Glycine max]
MLSWIKEASQIQRAINVALVKEFYANLYSSEGPSPKQPRVKGHLVKIDVDSLNTFLEILIVLEEGETLPIYSRYCRLPTDHREIEVALCIPGRGFILNAEGHLRRILKKDLTTLAQVWSVLSYSNLAPTSHTLDLTMDKARLIFGLVSHMDMNIGALILGQMTSIAQSNSFRLGKNCWNIDDLTVAFRGARRVRPADIPSSSTAPTPTPASTSAAPSVPAHVDLQRFEAMLQSIHQGQIILLQSLQVVAPPGSILSMEQFLERVAWLGAQPSLDREGEGPTVQVPQQVQDASSETTIPEPFTLHPEVGEEQARLETATTPERSLEGTSEPPTPVADLSSSQPASDPSTPVLDILEDQTTPVLALNTSPPATPVLHLTDKEDAQT